MKETTGEMGPEKEKQLAAGDKGKQLVVPNSDLHAVKAEDMTSQPSSNTHPKPLAKYQDVVADRRLFLETLEKLHSTMGTKFILGCCTLYLKKHIPMHGLRSDHLEKHMYLQNIRVPTVGGKELDLHRLFVEVTSRGGIEQVIRDRRWREVIAVFNFPSTATNASFVLRKYYMSLMHQYEQIYFFESQIWHSPSIASLNASSTSVPPKRLPEPIRPSNEMQSGAHRRRRNNNDLVPSGLSLPTNCPVVGVIDGKCEHGYFVTVTVGTAKLKGILYHPPDHALAQAAQSSGITSNSMARVARRRRRRKKLSKRDPTHPKPNRSGYNFFFAEQHARLKPLHPGKDREISKMIGELWNKLTETEKAVYQEKGVKDKERYRSEMELYRQGLKAGQIISNAVPIQQRPAEPEAIIGDVNSKMEIDEDDLPLTNQNDSSTDANDSEGKNSGTDSELETSQEMAGAATESTSVAADLSTEGDAYELRRRDDVGMKNENDLPSSSEDVESRKVRGID